MPFTHTLRSGNKKTLDFEIDDFLKYRADNPDMALHINGKAETIAGHFGLDYQGQAQLRESQEYLAVSAAYAEANNVDVGIFACKSAQESRGSIGITKSDKVTIGEKFIVFAESRVDEPDEEKEFESTSEWANTSLDNAISDLLNMEWVAPARPEAKPKPTPSAKKAELEDELAKKEEQLAKAEAALAAAGISL